jgi:small-conductance mechanosensitive channel
MWTRLFEGPADWQAILTAIVSTVLIAWLVARTVRRLAATGLRKMLRDTLVHSSPLVRGPLRLVGALVFLLVFSLLLFPAFELAGLRPKAGIHLTTITAWGFEHGTKVLLIGLLAYGLVRAVGLLVKRFEHEVTQGTGFDALERAKRARTLGTVVSQVSNVLIAGIAILMVLREFEIDIAPVLTGAGIAGLAVGFGAQTLVRDVISGFFLILEDQVRVGDVATINGTSGLIEQINLRTVVLRDIEGAVHVFPNGAITTLANRSKDFSYYVVDVGVPYHENLDRVEKVLRETGAELQKDPAFSPFILEPLQILGVETFADWSVVIKVRIKTVPLKQWDVGRELRKRIRQAFDRHDIEAPFPGKIPPRESTT